MKSRSGRNGSPAAEEALETLRAIRSGSVDAFVVHTPDGEGVYVLETADRPYRLMVEQMQQGAATLDEEGVVLYANPRLAALAAPGNGTGIVGSTFESLFVAGEQPRLHELVAAARLAPASLETRLRGAGHGEVPVSIAASPLRAGVAAVWVLVTDLGETKRLEALEVTERSFRILADSSPVPVWVTDRKGLLVYVNRAFADFFGVGASPVPRSGWEAFLHPEDAAAYLAAFRSALDAGAPFHASARVKSVDGEWHWVASYGAPWHEGGELLGCVGSSPDFTDLKRAEQALAQANAQLVEADRGKSEFLAVLSHELRNPLMPIRNSLFILEHAAPGDEESRAAREVIGRQTRHMARLIDDLLELTRLSRGKVRLQPEVLDLVALVRRCVEDHRAALDTAGIALELRLPGGPVFVEGDPTRLAQVVGNLLSNVCRFAGAGRHAWVSLESTAGSTVLKVRDDGAGIRGDLLASIFEPFVQGESTLDRSRGGLGLGLAVSKGLVELHGGRITAGSEGPGKGAEFVVTLEAATPQARRVAARLAGAPKDRPGRPVDPRPRRILVIEDNKDAAESLKTVLELRGHEVAVAATAPEGIQKALDLRPDLVLCDIGLPGMDGYEVARALRNVPALSSTTLVALSGYALPEDVERAREAGFDLHAAKPVDPDQFLG